MLDMDTAFVNALRADTTLMALVNDQVHWYLAPKDAVQPYLVLMVAGGTDNRYADTDLRFATYRVIAEGKGGLTVMQIADRVREMLHEATLSVAGNSSDISCEAGETIRNVVSIDDEIYTQGITEFFVKWKNVY